jgi:hypothetical protein
MKFWLFLFAPLALFGVTILNVTPYERTDRVDVMITFDMPYTGQLVQQQLQGIIKVHLSDTKYNKPATHLLKNRLISKITITPMHKKTEFLFYVKENTVMQASRTIDKYGLRLRLVQHQPTKIEPNKPLTPMATIAKGSESDSFTTNLIIVIAFLSLLVIIMLMIKRKVSGDKSSAGWLFPKNSSSKDGVNILFQKNIDPQNRVVMLQYGIQKYLVLVGNSNLVLDKFENDKPLREDEFESILNKNRAELDSFMNLDHNSGFDSLESFKEKVNLQ